MKKTLIVIGFATLIVSCSSPKSEENKNDTKGVASVTLEAKETSSISAYMTLKDAFVKSDVTAANAAASALAISLASDEMNVEIIEASNLIASSDDLDAQRVAFKTVTDGLIQALKADGENIGVFVQHCPMAFDNTGANWLSTSEEIRNPYFGDRMLKCGRVEETL